MLEAIEAEGAENAKKLTETEAELKTARDSVADLTEKVKSFDGVDVAAIKNSAEYPHLQSKIGVFGGLDQPIMGLF